jgi:hypothetical protein
MGDSLVEPLSLRALDTTSVPPSRHRYRPGRPVRSAEHGNVVPDVPATPRRAGCGACGGGKTPCQRHVSPRNPIRFETTVDTPPAADGSPHGATSQAGPNPGRHHVRARRHHPHQQSIALPDAFASGQRLVHRSAAHLPQTSSGRAPITATSASRSLIPFTLCCANCPARASTPMSPEPSRQSSDRGYANNHLPHTQCICGCLVGPGEGRGPWRRRNGSIRCGGPRELMGGLHCGDRPRQVVMNPAVRLRSHTTPRRTAQSAHGPGPPGRCSRCVGLRLEGLRQGLPVVLGRGALL